MACSLKVIPLPSSCLSLLHELPLSYWGWWSKVLYVWFYSLKIYILDILKIWVVFFFNSNEMFRILEMEQRWNVNFNKNVHTYKWKNLSGNKKSYIFFITSEHEHYCLLWATILLLLQILKYQMCQSTAVPNKCMTHCWNAFQKLQSICLSVNYFSNYEHINVYICILATYVKNTFVNNTSIIEIKSKIFVIFIVLLIRQSKYHIQSQNM